MPSPRFDTPKTGILQLLKKKPSLHFAGQTKSDWKTWQRTFKRRLLDIMGPRPEAVPVKPVVLEDRQFEGVRRQKIAFQSDPFSTVIAYVLTPNDIGRGERRPGILVAHGHGNGKGGMIGEGDEAGKIYKSIGLELCRAGFVVIAPDWRSFGERRDASEYIDFWSGEHGRDGCDLSYMLYGYFGYQLLTLNVCDAMRCIDYLQSRKDVDGSRIGMVGCSFGGTMTTYTSALDPRVKAACISGYVSTIEDAINDRGKGNTCGSQFMFGLRSIGDISDVAGLIAPRACLVQVGRQDPIFVDADAMKAFGHLKKIYRAAGASGELELDHFDGVHEINAPPIVEFFRRRLARM